VIRPAISYPSDLPILTRKDEILEAIRRHPVVIVAGETGSGKTTQLPKICLEAGRGTAGMIGCTQPRRIAALSVSRRIAEELGVTWGREVGCKIRFTDETSPDTCIKLMTDGILLAEIQSDPDLRVYDTILIDEAHERSLNIDFLLGYLRRLRSRRPDLKIVVTSATIDVEAFSTAFDHAPVIEVSGRMFPVEIRHCPMEELARGDEDYTYIDAALHAVDTVMTETPTGDVLVFMPTEKDIHETRRRLEGRAYRHTEVLPLFGRLTVADQQRVFSSRPGRRIVVATNIAETSLTIPHIRYVIDTGLARISRYNPRNHTQRLPVESVSQSSARQRAGRCGRVSGGVCIRLYGEKDLLARPLYTPPEIQRADLSEVVLRMLALRLGDVYTFPFLDPPRKQAIQSGFQKLEELGALDAQQRLTPMGRAMARLPVPPTVSRMLLQAQKEGALRETLVVAAGISIQDPRVRPVDQQKNADTEHRKFAHPESDFLSLLNIWNTYHETLEHLQTQSAMHRFCRTHFLAYNRMREWRDVYEQLRRALRETGIRADTPTATYEAVHRSILTGLLSSIAEKKEANLYRAAHGREVVLFPGSVLFYRKPGKETPETKTSSRAPDKTPTPAWIVAGEIVETSRLFARTAARIDPRWIAELGRHRCRPSYTDPRWDRATGRVVVMETLTLYGLQISRKSVSYDKIDPVQATEIFVQEALINEDITVSYPFLEHNQKVRHQVETFLLRQRTASWGDIDTAARDFYLARLAGVSCIADLNRKIKTSVDPRFLLMQDTDLTRGQTVSVDPEDFPDHVLVEGEKLPLVYACRPGHPEDGVTLTMPFKLSHFIAPETLDWLVPGLLPEKIEALLRTLPQRFRKMLVPVPDTARRIADEIEPSRRSLRETLNEHLKHRYKLVVTEDDWREGTLPEYLRMRVRITDPEGNPVFEGRDLKTLHTASTQTSPEESSVWTREAEKWERHDLRGWTCGDLPERVEIARTGALPLFGFPGLQTDGPLVHTRLFRDPLQAMAETRKGLVRLGEIALQTELAWLRRDLKTLRDLPELCVRVGGSEILQGTAYRHLLRALFERETLHPLTTARFTEDIEKARGLLKGLPAWFVDQMRQISAAFRDARKIKYEGIEQDINRLVPPDFLDHTPTVGLPHLIRYIRAVGIRAERAAADTAKDRRKAEQVAPFANALARLEKRTDIDMQALDAYRRMVEEYRVSVFAQELGTSEPVSEKRLFLLLKQCEA